MKAKISPGYQAQKPPREIAARLQPGRRRRLSRLPAAFPGWSGGAGARRPEDTALPSPVAGRRRQQVLSLPECFSAWLCERWICLREQPPGIKKEVFKDANILPAPLCEPTTTWEHLGWQQAPFLPVRPDPGRDTDLLGKFVPQVPLHLFTLSITGSAASLPPRILHPTSCVPCRGGRAGLEHASRTAGPEAPEASTAPGVPSPCRLRPRQAVLSDGPPRVTSHRRRAPQDMALLWLGSRLARSRSNGNAEGREHPFPPPEGPDRKSALAWLIH
ncbi:uncharacterized protein [Struthio camelus]|uniref:uncharacterized protein n=1 Tax=Struthio camelus TaxID=8801 RepID=UPI003603B97E